MAAPPDSINIQEAVRQFHANRSALREACDCLVAPLAKANDFLNNALSSEHSATPHSFFPGFEKAAESIRNLFSRGGPLEGAGGSEGNNPCLVVVGQTKAGKSSLINALLGGEFVSQMDLACTARLTRLTWGRQLRVRCRHPDGRVEAWEDVTGQCIPARLVQLHPTERGDQEKVNVVVEAEVPSDFLACGIDIYDSPGRNENRQLRTLTDRLFSSLVPMLVYVIDGRKKLSHEDLADLDLIRCTHPALRIFFVVTKLDLPRARRQRASGPPDEISAAARTLASIRRSLENRSLLPESPSRSELALLHGVSLLRVAEEREQSPQANNKTTESADTPHELAEAFRHLRCQLFRFVADHLELCATDAAKDLQSLASAVLGGCVQRANSNVQANFRNLKHLKVRQALEEIIYAHLLRVLRSEQETIAARINDFLSSCRGRIINKAAAYIYSPTLGVPVGSKIGLPNDSPLLESCLEALRDFILLSVTTELRSFMEEVILHDQLEELRRTVAEWDPEVGDTFRRLDNLVMAENSSEEEEEEELSKEERREKMHSFIRETSTKILASYSTALEEAVKRLWLFQVFDKVRDFFHSLWRGFKSLFSRSGSRQNSGEDKKSVVDPNSAEWKRRHAEELYDRIRRMSLGADICQIVLDHVGHIHKAQQARFAEEEALCRVYKQIAREDRQRIADLTKPFAVSHLIATSVISGYKLTDVEIQSPLGVGSQGTVYKCLVRDSAGNEQQMAMKQVLISDKFLAQQALEIFYTLDFDHPNLLPLLGVHYEARQEQETHRIRLFSPLMAVNCRNFLNKGHTSPLSERLRIGRQVCAALAYLHDHGIIHRDIKLENVLLDERRTAYVADFGLCKPVGLTNWSVVGSPIHMAPEIIDNALVAQTSRETVTYNEAVDIYAFGILLWYLVDGSGKHPDFVKEMRDVYEVLSASRFGQRPERPPEASDAIWKLIEECWTGVPDERPSIRVVESRLATL